MVWAWMLSSSSALEHDRYYGFGMDALVTVCSWNMNVILVWTWMLSTSSALEHKHSYGLGMDALNIRVHPNTNIIMVWAWMLLSSSALEAERYYGLGMDALVIECTRSRTLLWFGHGCSYHRVHSKPNVIMVWAWMLSSSSALEHERLVWAWVPGALVTVCY